MAEIKNTVQLFEEQTIRTAWDEEQEEWYFSIVDVVGALTESPNPRKYWSVLKIRLKKEGNQSVTNCSQLKMRSSDGKWYKTDVANTEQLLRIIQSIPSPKAEPFKLWLAKGGREQTESPNPNNYWKVLKKRLLEEGNQSVTNCNQLKLKSPKDGKPVASEKAENLLF